MLPAAAADGSEKHGGSPPAPSPSRQKAQCERGDDTPQPPLRDARAAREEEVLEAASHARRSSAAAASAQPAATGASRGGRGRRWRCGEREGCDRRGPPPAGEHGGRRDEQLVDKLEAQLTRPLLVARLHHDISAVYRTSLKRPAPQAGCARTRRPQPRSTTRLALPRRAKRVRLRVVIKGSWANA